MTTPFAPGTHLLVDFYDAENLEDSRVVEQALRDAAAACGATCSRSCCIISARARG
jgi:hypothetical protein